MEDIRDLHDDIFNIVYNKHLDTLKEFKPVINKISNIVGGIGVEYYNYYNNLYKKLLGTDIPINSERFLQMCNLADNDILRAYNKSIRKQWDKILHEILGSEFSCDSGNYIYKGITEALREYYKFIGEENAFRRQHFLKETF